MIFGSVEAMIHSKTYSMEAAVMLCYRSSTPHTARNVGTAPASVFWVTCPPTRVAHQRSDMYLFRLRHRWR